MGLKSERLMKILWWLDSLKASSAKVSLEKVDFGLGERLESFEVNSSWKKWNGDWWHGYCWWAVAWIQTLTTIEFVYYFCRSDIHGGYDWRRVFELETVEQKPFSEKGWEQKKRRKWRRKRCDYGEPSALQTDGETCLSRFLKESLGTYVSENRTIKMELRFSGFIRCPPLWGAWFSR